MPTKKRRTATKYQQLVKAKSSHCKGRTTKAAVRKKANAYIADAVKKGMSKTEATKKANKVLKRACSVSGTKKKTTRRKRK